MNGNQMMLSIAAMIFLSMLILNVHSSTTDKLIILYSNEAVIEATGIVQAVFEEIQTKAFDENTVSDAAKERNLLTPVLSLGADSSEAVYTERVDEAIEQADAEVDSYLSVRFLVPVSNPPTILNKLSTDIAIYNLYSRGIADEIPEVRKDRYKNAIKTLEKISTGKISLDVSPLPDPIDQEGGSESSTPDDTNNIFTRDKLEGF